MAESQAWKSKVMPPTKEAEAMTWACQSGVRLEGARNKAEPEEKRNRWSQRGGGLRC